MFTILFLLLLLGLMFPKPVGSLLNGITSVTGKILYPFTIGLLKAIGMILKWVFNALWGILQWFTGMIARLFDAIRF